MTSESGRTVTAGVAAVHEPARGNGASPLYRMEDVVKRTGLTSRAIRYYEEVGLLTAPSRTAGGFRLFSEDDVARLTRIKELQTLLGASLAEIKETLRVDAARAVLRQEYQQATDAGTRLGIVDRAAALIQSQIDIIDERINRLMQLRADYAERLARLGTTRAQITDEQSPETPR
jgi:MerR family transcriptional regulator, repressor of the yfmOP operon